MGDDNYPADTRVGTRGWSSGWSVGNRRRRGPGAGHGLPVALRPTPGAGNFAVYPSSADWSRCPPRLLEKRSGGFARGDLLRMRVSPRGVCGGGNRCAHALEYFEEHLWGLSDAFGGAALAKDISGREQPGSEAGRFERNPRA